MPLQERAGQGHSLPVGWQPGWGQGPGGPACPPPPQPQPGLSRQGPGRTEADSKMQKRKGEDAEEEGNDDTDLRPLMADKDDSISCELGIRYPMLQAILSGDRIMLYNI